MKNTFYKLYSHVAIIILIVGCLAIGLISGVGIGKSIGRNNLIKELPEAVAKAASDTTENKAFLSEGSKQEITERINKITQMVADKRVRLIDSLSSINDNSGVALMQVQGEGLRREETNNDSIEFLRKENRRLALLLEAQENKTIALNASLKIKKTDTVFSYKNDPMVKAYYPPEKLGKIGIGQKVLPLYGLRAQVLLNQNFSLHTTSIGPGVRYDWNKFSFLLAEYYNITNDRFSTIFNVRYDVIRF